MPRWPELFLFLMKFLVISFVCCSVVWFQISVELIAWVASMLKLLEFLWCEYLFVIFVIMGVDCCKSCWGFPKEMSSLQRRQWWYQNDNHTMTMKITLRQWQWYVNHTMTMKEKMIARTRGAFFAWRAHILSWPRIMCSQVRMLKFLESSWEML